ncbi:hypothetical protein GFY24_39590 [Nocardia sp. SYP-A9097]|uniref:hypothetical protein n=1 Tax=Nocardia sp. SYP-A9097 TaxID=2663237 RepID=UPI00132B2639|nr:hypothetical protein [Nocardia sp. SYP-A9097]
MDSTSQGNTFGGGAVAEKFASAFVGAILRVESPIGVTTTVACDLSTDRRRLPSSSIAMARNDIPALSPREIDSRSTASRCPARARCGAGAIPPIVIRYESGEPSTALMKAFGLSRGSVLKVLRETGVTMP